MSRFYFGRLEEPFHPSTAFLNEGRGGEFAMIGQRRESAAVLDPAPGRGLEPVAPGSRNRSIFSAHAQKDAIAPGSTPSPLNHLSLRSS
ncbi:MAG: hypothetical protein ACP5E5_01910 [Acidobacteriaceae bacterium]